MKKNQRGRDGSDLHMDCPRQAVDPNDPNATQTFLALSRSQTLPRTLLLGPNRERERGAWPQAESNSYATVG